MKVLFLGDLHFGYKSDSRVHSKYLIAFFKTILFPYLKANNIKVVIQFGDLVHHRKHINIRVMTEVFDEYFDLFEAEGIRLVQMLGNHDVFYKNTNRVNAINNLLGRSNFKHIEFVDQFTTIDIDGIKFDIIPWITSDNEIEIFDKISKSNSQFLCGHLELPGFTLSTGIKSRSGTDVNVFKRYDKVYTGHYHIKSSSANVQYLGIPYELNWGDIHEDKGFWVFDTATKDAEFVPTNYKLYYKILFDDLDFTDHDFAQYKDSFLKISLVSDTKEQFPDFISKVYDSLPADVAVLNVLAETAKSVEVEDIELEDSLTILKRKINGSDVLEKEEIIALVESVHEEAILKIKETT